MKGNHIKILLIISTSIFLQILSSTKGNLLILNDKLYSYKEYSLESLIKKDLEEQGEYIVANSNDPWLIIENVNSRIKDIEINVEDSSLEAFKIQIFYSKDGVFSEENSLITGGKKGKNKIYLESSQIVKDLRIDISDTPMHRIKLGDIRINKGKDLYFSVVAIIFNMITLIYIIKGSRGYCIRIRNIVICIEIFAVYMMNRIVTIMIQRGTPLEVVLGIILIGALFLMIDSFIKISFEGVDKDE